MRKHEKWARRRSKIFFASVMFRIHDDEYRTVIAPPTKAKNI
jgi:hypothetical protein